jgi:hypothetical protein
MIYAASFFLAAVGERTPGSRPIPGHFCAYFSLIAPLQSTSLHHESVFDGRPFEYFSLVVAGWINPVFLISVILSLREGSRGFSRILRIVVSLTIPFCWIVFGYQDFYPREGHFVWIIGMLLVLFSDPYQSVTTGIEI